MADYHDRIMYFKDNYTCVFSSISYDGSTPSIIEPDDQICRFCGKKSPEVSFNKIAHAIPELIGNKEYISSSECDSCNILFSRLLENNFDSYLGMLRSVMQTDGKKGVPNLFIGNPEKGFGLSISHDNPDAVIIKTGSEGEVNAIIDTKAKEISLYGGSRSYIPIAIYKLFVKIAISIMPYSLTQEFHKTKEWIREKKHTSERYWGQTALCFQVFVPGPKPFRDITAFLFIRKKNAKNVPYCQFVIAFDNLLFQMIIPCPDNDKNIKESIEIPLFPHIYDPLIYQEAIQYTEKYGRPLSKRINLSSAEKIKQSQSLKMKASSIEETAINNE